MSYFLQSGFVVVFFFFLQVLQEVEELIKVKKESICVLRSTFIIPILLYMKMAEKWQHGFA